MLMHGFDPTQVDPTQGAGSLPVGRHPVVIKESEVKATKDEESGYVEFSLEIIDGPAKGQTGPYRLHLYNKSEKAVKNAQRQLSALCHVTQTFRLGSDGRQLSELYNKAFVVDVRYQKGHNPATDGEEAKGYTEVDRVYDMQGNEPGKGGQAAPNTPQQNNGFQNQGGNNASQNQGGNNGGGTAANGGWNQNNGNGGNQQQQEPQNNGGGNGGWNQGNNGGNNQSQAQDNSQNNGGGNAGWNQNQGGNNGGGESKPSWGQR